MWKFTLLTCSLLVIQVVQSFRLPRTIGTHAVVSTGFMEGRNSGPLVPNRQRFTRSTTSTRLYGIPKLFRWLTELYPLILESVGEGISSNAMTVDNFYLDMNGIIHTCTHSNNDRLIPLKEKEMFLRIFAYTDRLYKLVNPSKMMYLAVDGVAPRAKMNQQRSRRFRSSQEREALIAEHIAREGKLPEEESFDSNCITPGTEFMFRLGVAFRNWIEYKMATDPFWQNGAEVIFSGPDVPGEGEHKVMDRIRFDRDSDPEYAPGKYRHCLYGLDADLIMLSLVTHEPFFVLLREKITRRKQSKDALTYSQEDFECLEVTILRQMLKQHYRKLMLQFDKAAGEREGKAGESNNQSEGDEAPTPAVRSWTSAEETAATKQAMRDIAKWSSGFDLNRIIDDFVFMCFFIGNDFLPCIPHLDIADGSLNWMMNTYRDILPSLGGYLTDKTSVHVCRVEIFLQELARREALYFQQRAVDEKDEAYGDDGYRAHYYQMKFGIEPGDEESIRSICQSYLEGLFWVLSYYHAGCESWTWYYPYLYAPLASDLVNLADFDIKFSAGRPFTPLLQLLSVLPAQSGNFLPPSYASLMTGANSALVDYYPLDFTVDANGKKNAWESVVCIPFIDEEVLLSAVSAIDHASVLTEEERMRNIPGEEHSYLPSHRDIRAEIAAGTLGRRARMSEGAAAGGGGGGGGGGGTVNDSAGGWGNALINRRGGGGRGGGGGGRGSNRRDSQQQRGGGYAKP